MRRRLSPSRNSCVHSVGTRRLMNVARFKRTWKRRAHGDRPESLVRRLSLESHRVAVVHARRAGVLVDSVSGVERAKGRQLLGVGRLSAVAAASAAVGIMMEALWATWK
jgi:hypothetical protein